MSSKKSRTTAADMRLASTLNKMHQEYQTKYRLTAKMAIDLGQLLKAKKNSLDHGQWIPWCRKYLTFTDRMARNYIDLYEHADQVQADDDKKSPRSALSDLRNLRNSERTRSRTDLRDFRRRFAHANLPYTNPPKGHFDNQIWNGDNCDVMPAMLDTASRGTYDAVVTSPQYNAGLEYGHTSDQKPIEQYLQDLVSPFEYYPKLLRRGGRIIYVIGNYISKPDRKTGDYNIDIPYELRKAVEQRFPALRYYGNTIWDKGKLGKCPLRLAYGTRGSPRQPVPRACHEQIMVWSNEDFALPELDGQEPDLAEKEWDNLAWSIWEVAPHVHAFNPHPCSFPPKLVEQILRFWTYRGSRILDPYAGVATVAKACQRLGRVYTAIEVNPSYCAYGQLLLDTKGKTVSESRLRELLRDRPHVLDALNKCKGKRKATKQKTKTSKSRAKNAKNKSRAGKNRQSVRNTA